MSDKENGKIDGRFGEGLFELIKYREIFSRNIEDGFKKITEKTASVLDVERSSIWVFHEDRTVIRCVDLFESTKGRHSGGLELSSTEFPAYFAALNEERVIDAHDAESDPRTREFSETHLRPLGIESILDVPIHFNDRMLGVFRHENAGQVRRWKQEEVEFAVALADLISLTLEAHDREEAEKALKESEARFRDFAMTSSDYYFEMDENLRFSYFSERFTEITGVSPRELLGKTRQETGIPGLDEKKWRRHLADLEAHRPFRDFIHPRIHPDGRTVYLSISGIPIYDAGGRFKGYRCTGTDRTAEVETRQALEESEERFRIVVDNLPSFINLKDKDGRYLLINRKHVDIFGFQQRDIRGKVISDFLPEKHAMDATEQERKVIVRWSRKIGQLVKVYSAGYGGIRDDEATEVHA